MVRRKSTRIAVCLMSILLIISTFGMGTVAVSAAETDTQTSGAGGATAVLNNTAGWSTCYVYYWGNSGSVSNGTWPGVQLTDKDKNADGYYEVTIPESCLAETNGVIFNAGSGGAQSLDLDIASGECKLYNNKTGSWEEYDTNPLKLQFEADCESPQYKGTDIVLKATASGTSGPYTYTFKANSTTIYTGSNSTCTWTPTTAGTYTVSVEVSDGQNKNSKSLSFEIKDDSTAEEPVLKGITTGYANNKVPVNSSVAINVNAAGGKIGTNLLFYKVEVLTPSGDATDAVYYRQSNILNFTPTQKGNYTVNVTVQNSHNADVKKTYTVTADTTTGDIAPSISSFTANPTTVEAGSNVTLKTVLASGTGTADFTYAYTANGTAIKSQTTSATSNSVTWTPAKAGTYTLKVTVTDSKNLTATKSITVTVTEPEKPDYTKGDVNADGTVNVQDTLYVMKCVNNTEGFVLTPGTSAFMAADMNGDSTISVIDVLAIMKAYLSA